MRVLKCKYTCQRPGLFLKIKKCKTAGIAVAGMSTNRKPVTFCICYKFFRVVKGLCYVDLKKGIGSKLHKHLSKVLVFHHNILLPHQEEYMK